MLRVLQFVRKRHEEIPAEEIPPAVREIEAFRRRIIAAYIAFNGLLVVLAFLWL